MPPGMKGILCIKFDLFKIKSTDFWAAYGIPELIILCQTVISASKKTKKTEGMYSTKIAYEVQRKTKSIVKNLANLFMYLATLKISAEMNYSRSGNMTVPGNRNTYTVPNHSVPNGQVRVFIYRWRRLIFTQMSEIQSETKHETLYSRRNVK